MFIMIPTLGVADLLKGDRLIINTIVGLRSATLYRQYLSYDAMPLITKESDWFVFSHGETHIGLEDNIYSGGKEVFKKIDVTFELPITYEGV